jgi:hypothetical protein
MEEMAGEERLESIERRLGGELHAALDARLEATRDGLLAALREEAGWVRQHLSRELEAAKRSLEEERRGLSSSAEEHAEMLRRRLGGHAAEIASRLEATVARIEQGERRILAAVSRAEAAERNARVGAIQARDVADWEGRMRSAGAVEEEVARRIEAAERRLRILVTDGD